MHQVDDGLPLRKSALACLESLLDSAPQLLDLPAFVADLLKLLSDKDDVKLSVLQVM